MNVGAQAAPAVNGRRCHVPCGFRVFWGTPARTEIKNEGQVRQ
jgi:hypothetical protein